MSRQLERSGAKRNPDPPENLDTAGPKASDGARTIVIGPYETKPDETVTRSAAARLSEINGLAEAIDLDIVSSGVMPLKAIRPATYLGKGRIEDLAVMVAAEDAELIVIDAILSPTQQRNLERELKAKVLDRTALILEIFGARAQTKEGSLQVEHAHLTYQKSRLVRSWTHLERQRGGFGFLGGPGETQIEADRRQIQERLNRIERDLETVRRTRGLHRHHRKRRNTPVGVLVGYTNAGKSTLFNQISGAGVLSQDLLFATLDPTSRQIDLGDSREFILSDTVGFVSSLPTSLIAAFRATLEEVVEADIIIHVQDVSAPDHEAQHGDVLSVLGELGVEIDENPKIINVLNKIDRLPDDKRSILVNQTARARGSLKPVLCSSMTGEGIDELLATIRERLSDHAVEECVFELQPQDGAAMNWLYEVGKVLDRETSDDGVTHMRVILSKDRANAFQSRFSGVQRSL